MLVGKDRLETASRIATVVMGTGAFLAFLYVSKPVVITLFSSILISIALDPVVEIMKRRLRLSRPLASVISVVVTCVVVYFACYFMYARSIAFLRDAPSIAQKIQQAPVVKMLSEKMESIDRTYNDAMRRFSHEQSGQQDTDAASHTTVVQKEDYKAKILKGLGSLSSMLFFLGFVPFLVYFILSWKEQMMDRIGRLFGQGNERRTTRTVLQIERMMQKFLLGNLLVTGIVCVLTVVTFMAIRMPYAILIGMFSGILSMVPYLGAFLSVLPGLAVGIVAFETPMPFIVIVASTTVYHFAAVHVLTPKLIGGGVSLNAVSATIAILLFGWLWGGAGLILGIPVVAIVKNIMDAIESTRRIGYLLGDEKTFESVWEEDPEETPSGKEKAPAAGIASGS